MTIKYNTLTKISVWKSRRAFSNLQYFYSVNILRTPFQSEPDERYHRSSVGFRKPYCICVEILSSYLISCGLRFDFHGRLNIVFSGLEVNKYINRYRITFIIPSSRILSKTGTMET